MVKKNKDNDTRIRLFLTLCLLKEKPSSTAEIIKFLKEKVPDNIEYTNETILKYINTLKVFGIKMMREKDKYTILNIPPYIDLNNMEIKGLNIFKNTELIDGKLKKIRQQFLLNLEKRFSDSARISISAANIPQKINLYYEKNIELINQIEKFIHERVIVKLKTKDGKSYEVMPLDINYFSDKKIYFTVYLKNRNKNLDIEISDIESLEYLHSLCGNIHETSITFKLKRRLAKTYELREGEKIIRFEDDGSAVVINNLESENILLKRLLRYGNLCEVVSPLEVRLNMKKIIDEMYNQYC